jgi:diguanylate cyclase (GGDEF)-like protein
MSWDGDSRANVPSLRQILSRGHQVMMLTAVGLSVICLSLILLVVARSYTERNLTLVAETLNYTLEPAIVFNDRDAMAKGIASVVGDGTVRRVEIIDPAGKVLLDWTDAEDREAPVWEVALEQVLVPNALSQPVARDGVEIATLRIHPGIGPIAGYILIGLIIALCSLAITILATRILASKLQEVILEPLQRIASAAHSVRRDRSFSTRVEPAGIAEIDSFSRDFNALLDELEGWHKSVMDENRTLAFQALHDPLTGLGNRVQFENVFHDFLRRAVRAHSSFALLYIDLDRFKPINDVYGHMVGDMVLAEVASRLSGSIRKTDQAFRLGGDEFAVLLDFGLVSGHMQTVVSKLEQSLAEPILVSEGITVVIGQSMGWAVFPDHGAAMEDLVRRADNQMYEHKRSNLRAML